MQRNQLAPMDVDRQAQPRPRRRGAAADPSPLPRHCLPGAAIIGTVVLAVLVAACTSASTPSTGTGASAVGYSHCMRSHGVPNYPDPNSNGQLPKGGAQQFGVSSAQYQTAQQACQHLLPTGGSLQQQEQQCMENSDCPQALVQQMMSDDEKLAGCMRTHGVPNFPDPTNGGPSGPWFNISKVGISDAASHTPRFIAKLNECARLVGDNAPESFG